MSKKPKTIGKAKVEVEVTAKRKPLFELELHAVGGFLRGKNLVDRLRPKGTSLIPEGAKVHIEAFLVEEVKD